MDTQNQPITKTVFSQAHKAAISAGLKGRKQSEAQKAARKATWKRKMELKQSQRTVSSSQNFS